jgi:hypothetical protein
MSDSCAFCDLELFWTVFVPCESTTNELREVIYRCHLIGSALPVGLNGLRTDGHFFSWKELNVLAIDYYRFTPGYVLEGELLFDVKCRLFRAGILMAAEDSDSDVGCHLNIPLITQKAFLPGFLPVPDIRGSRRLMALLRRDPSVGE